MVMCDIENLTATEIMTRDVVCLNEDLTLHECEKILLERGISGAPVVDQQGQLLGVLSKTDLVTHHFTSGEEEVAGRGSYRLAESRGFHVVQFDTATAREAMTPVPCVATEWARLGELAALMVRREVHRVVVCRQRKVVGIVSSMDILRAIASRKVPDDWDPAGFPG